MLALAPTWEWAILGMVSGTISSSLVGSSFNSFTAEQAPKGSMSSTFGLVNALSITCMVVGPLMGGAIAEHHGYKTMLWVGTAIHGTATIMWIWLIRYEKTKPKRMRPAELLADVRGLLALIFAGGLLLWLCIGGGMVDASRQLVGTFAPKYITEVGHLSETSYSALYAMMSLASAVVMLPGGIFADRFGECWGIALGASLFGSAWLAMTVMPKTMLVFSVVAIVAGIGRAFSAPAIASLVSKSVPETSRGIAWGAYMTLLSMFAIPLPYLGGVLYDNLRPEAAFVLIAALSAIAVPLAVWKLHPPSEDHKRRIADKDLPAPPAR
jgi:MFS family permease